MPANLLRGDPDEVLLQLKSVLDDYAVRHPRALIDFYRSNPMSIRVRVINPEFKGLSVSDRHDLLWKELASLPDDAQQDVSMLILLTPDEAAQSPANLEFEHPAASRN